MQKLRDELFEFFLSADKNGAIRFIEDWVKSNSYEKALIEIVAPALEEFGKKWASQKDINMAQG